MKNRPSGQFFTSSPRYAGNVKPSLLSHDVLTSPALLDFPSKASSLGKPCKAGARCRQFINTYSINMNEIEEVKKRKIAFEIVYYFKRIILCIFLFAVYYLVIYNKYAADYIYSNSNYQKDWLLGEYMEYQDFLMFLFNLFFVIVIALILFHRQIKSSYLWLKKYSKQN